MSTITAYREPVARLLEIGRPDVKGPWLDYTAYGVSSEDIPELIRLAGDIDLSLDEGEGKDSWGPVHAWRALGQLRAEEAVNSLIDLTGKMSKDGWLVEEMPEVFARVGPTALPSLTAFLADEERERDIAALSISRIGVEYPEARERCVRILSDQLEQFERNGSTLNGLIIADLILELAAKEALPLVRKVFDLGYVDELVIRWADVRREKEKWYKKYQKRHPHK